MSATPIDGPVVAVAAEQRVANPWRDGLSNVLRQRSAQVGLVLIGLLVVTALFASVIAPYDQYTAVGINEGLGPTERGPCWHLVGCPSDRPEHIFGVDEWMEREVEARS